MPMLLTALDDMLVAGFRAGDERAFEQLVHARFDPLAERARVHLGSDGAGAPRVALAVLLSAWSERARFGSAAALDDYLDEVLPQRCADELRRRAALHRFEHHEGVQLTPPNARPGMTAQQAWEEIATRLHVTDDDVAAHRDEARRIARRHAREHVDTVARRRLPVGVLVTGALLLAAAVGLMRWMDRGSAELALTRALESPDVRYLRSSAGQRSTITLLDESTAQLGAMSTLKVPRGFGSAVRGLELDGAARFVVSPDRSPAFQVRARGAAVVATGTEFVARAYEDDTALYVMVREGTVRLHPVAGAASSRSLAAGDAVALDANGTVRELDDAERAQAFSWIDGTLRLEGATVADAVRLMTRWHALTPTLADPSLAARSVTTTLSLESDAAALDSLTRAAGLVSTYDGTTLVLRDAAAVPPKAPPMPPKAAARKR